MSRSRRLAASALVAMLAAGVPGAVAATANRVWVSGHGVDQAGCGAPTAPCRSLQYAHDNAVNAGGEIDILDPAGYGAITITKSVSIVNDGVGTAGVQTTSGDAITINAGANDAVYLRGLNIDGVQDLGDSGIVLNAAGSLTVLDCVVRHFRSDGILLQPTTGALSALIANTVTNDNLMGVVYDPASGGANANIVIDRVVASKNSDGIYLRTINDSGSVFIVVSNSIASNEATSGLTILGSITSKFAVDMSHFDNNGTYGADFEATSKVVLSRSVFDLNGTGVRINVDSGQGGYVGSAGDNHIDGDLVAVSGGAFSSAPTQ